MTSIPSPLHPSSSSWCDTAGWGPIADDQISFTSCFQDTVLFGIPAIIASIAFLIRARHLRKYCHPHALGRVSILYWPSQVALSGTLMILLGRILSSTNGLLTSELFATLSLIVAWVLAIRLNSLESLYKIRSSSLILVFELVSLTFSLPRLISLYRLQDPTDVNLSEFYFRSHYLTSIAISFVFETWPRGRTSVQKESGASRFDKANIFSRWTFNYMQALISLGFRQPLKMNDIQDMMPSHLKTLEGPYQLLFLQWTRHVAEIKTSNRLKKNLISVTHTDKATMRKEPNLMWVILRTFWRELTSLAILHILRALLQFVQPALLRQILIFLESPSDSDSKAHGIALALCMLAVSITLSIIMGQFYARTVETSVRIRSALVGMIYRKSLVLSPGARKSATSGEITNYMSTDAEKWITNLVWMIMWVSIPIEFIVATVMLYDLIGWSVFCGMAILLMNVPIQGWAGGFMDSIKSGKMQAQDSRVRLMTEILANIKIIKLYSYVEAFQQKVLTVRDKEVSFLRRAGTVDTYLTILYSCLPLLVAFVSFSVYATIGGPGHTPGEINAQTIFVSIALFAMLNRPISAMSMLIEATIGLRVAMRRVQGFLLKEEMDCTAVLHINELPHDTWTPVIQIAGATLAWNPGHDFSDQAYSTTEDTETTALLSEDARKAIEPTLFDINVSISRSSLTAVVGRVGQGKSSLLSAMIGEMYKRHGSVKVFGSIAYVPQQAWIVNATLRENIVFGKPFDQQKYDRILNACGLLPDIEILVAKDLTEIGERGINLSGGQKQRISLARAVYQDADIYLLDDPLSAVDAHVDQHLWEHLIGPKGMLSHKTRVIVTHGIHHLEQVDHILVVKNGRITEAGDYRALMSARDAFYYLIKDFSVAENPKKATSKTGKTSKADDALMDKTMNLDSSTSVSTPTSSSNLITTSDGEAETGTVVAVEAKDAKGKSGGELIAEEHVQGVTVQWKTFATYCKAMTYCYFTVTMILFIIWECFQLSVPLWLEHWIRLSSSTNQSTSYFLGIYALLVLAYVAADTCLTYVFKVTACTQASIVLHNDALERVMRLPMSFFDSIPQGRILNRFSSDVAGIDESIPFSLHQTILSACNLIGNLVIISFATPAFMLSIPPLALFYWAVQKYYSRTSNILKRLESVTKSPIYQHFSESLHGATSIRAMKLQQRFINENAEQVDKYANAFFAWSMTNRWMQYRLELLTTFVVFMSALLAVLNKDHLSASLVGLALSFTLVLVDHVTWLLRIFTRFQSDLVSVERVHEYSVRNTEAPLVTGVRVPESWPNQGHIVFKNYSARYREGLNLVLKNVSFDVQPGEKVGIVGRTGAGKSSLTLALFRIIEAADSYWAYASDQAEDTKPPEDQHLSAISASGDGGSITIDGIDISTLGLRDLRRHLAIIPQDPTLFAGTIRENLDPFSEMRDTELWTALDRAHLKDYISSMPGGLSYEVAQNGENFSVGQRSLICLARALLRKTKILILDEATAAVDVETDELIQRTIREEFKDRTVLTIAHRIKTIMDSDKILVLEKGRVQEFEAPGALLKRKEESLFWRLAKQTGEI